MTETTTISQAEQEIASIEQTLAEKKAALAETEQSMEAGSEQDKEALRQVLAEKIHSLPPQGAPAAGIHNATGSTPSYQLADLQEQVQTLVNLAFNKSIGEAIAQARATHNPALIDAFHDALTDELYAHLLERQKLTKL